MTSTASAVARVAPSNRGTLPSASAVAAVAEVRHSTQHLTWQASVYQDKAKTAAPVRTATASVRQGPVVAVAPQQQAP
jgi:hypothetical protein